MAGKITGVDIGWIAGFLEGEGHFSVSHGSCRVRANQVQREPLERLLGLIGGTLRHYPAPTPTRQPYHVWWCGSRLAVSLMMTIYSLMSPRRKKRIAECLEIWRRGPGRGWHRELTHCKYGHPFSARYWMKDGISRRSRQICMHCAELYNVRRRHPLSPEQKKALAANARRARWKKYHDRVSALKSL